MTAAKDHSLQPHTDLRTSETWYAKSWSEKETIGLTGSWYVGVF